MSLMSLEAQRRCFGPAGVPGSLHRPHVWKHPLFVWFAIFPFILFPSLLLFLYTAVSQGSSRRILVFIVCLILALKCTRSLEPARGGH